MFDQRHASYQVGAFSVWLEEGQPPRLEPRNEAWTNLANVLYLDWSVGVDCTADFKLYI